MKYILLILFFVYLSIIIKGEYVFQTHKFKNYLILRNHALRIISHNHTITGLAIKYYENYIFNYIYLRASGISLFKLMFNLKTIGRLLLRIIFYFFTGINWILIKIGIKLFRNKINIKAIFAKELLSAPQLILYYNNGRWEFNDKKDHVIAILRLHASALNFDQIQTDKMVDAYLNIWNKHNENFLEKKMSPLTYKLALLKSNPTLSPHMTTNLTSDTKCSAFYTDFSKAAFAGNYGLTAMFNKIQLTKATSVLQIFKNELIFLEKTGIISINQHIKGAIAHGYDSNLINYEMNLTIEDSKILLEELSAFAAYYNIDPSIYNLIQENTIDSIYVQTLEYFLIGTP